MLSLPSLRQTVKKVIRAGYWLWSRRLEGVAIQLPRSDYKSTWDHLAGRESDAKMFVASTVDERQLERSAAETLAVLDRTLSIGPDDVVLEIGCGIGRVGKALAPRCKRWLGADISPNMLEHARIRLSDHPNVQLIELDTVGLGEISDATVDKVYCTVVFMHLHEWDRYRYVEEARRVLKPGGRCYFDNIDLTSTHGWKVFMDSASYPPGERPAYLPMTSTVDELRTYATRAGFQDIEVHRWDDAWVAVSAAKKT